jgi:hypothetical protein
MSVLAFPSRFALLARAWAFQHANAQITAALNVRADTTSAWYSGATKNLNNNLNALNLSSKLASHLDETGVLAARGVSAIRLVQVLTQDDDLAFMDFLADQRKALPVPSSVRSAPINNMSALRAKIVGYSFLYRFGINLKKKSHGTGGFQVIRQRVLRRIPVQILQHDPNVNFFLYKDSYGLYGERYEPEEANGFVFCTKDFLTIFAEDVDPKGADVFLTHFGYKPLRVDGGGVDFFEGIILMNGDESIPTGAKVLLRGAPIGAADLKWQDYVSKTELAVPIGDKDKDGKFDVVIDTSDEETFNGEAINSPGFLWIANRLLIKKFRYEIPVRDDHDEMAD